MCGSNDIKLYNDMVKKSWKKVPTSVRVTRENVAKLISSISVFRVLTVQARTPPRTRPKNPPPKKSLPKIPRNHSSVFLTF